MKYAFVFGFPALVVGAACSKSEPSGTAASAAVAPAPAAPAAGSLKGFEGEITVTARSKKDEKPTPPITVAVKGARLRFDPPENVENGPKFPERPHVVLNVPEKKIYAIMDKEKQAVVIGLDNLGAQLSQWKKPAERGQAAEAPPKVTKTGHMDVVAGYSCEDWEFTMAKGERMRACVSGESAPWFALPSLALPAEHAWAKDLVDGQHLPLRFIGYDVNGAEESRLEVIRLEKKAMSDALFDVPAGYRVVDMGEMMKGVGALMGAMPPHGMAPGAMPMGFPSAMASGLPPGVKLELPPGTKIPANVEEMMKMMQERAKAAGIQGPPPKQ